MFNHTIKTGLKIAETVVKSRFRPVLAQIVVTRYCNLDCAYCNEFDKVSTPIGLETLMERIDALAALKTAIVTCTGGEPLTHPNVESVIGRIAQHGMIPTMITNGFFLTAARIKQLNQAGLGELQISIDNLSPDSVSKKSLKSLEGKLRLLAENADFHVNINSVLGFSGARADDALEVARAARRFGFSNSVSLIHDETGKLQPLTDQQKQTYQDIIKLNRSPRHHFNYSLFQKNLINGLSNKWHCRAGARALYICERGLVHWCSQQRGYPGIPLAEYTVDDIRREFETEKKCAPTCSLSCVHQASFFDEWRTAQHRPDPLAAGRVRIAGAPQTVNQSHARSV